MTARIGTASFILAGFFFALSSAAALAQAPPGLNDPHIGYVYPAGGQQGQTFEVTVGGQFLDGVHEVVVSGEGVEATVEKHEKPISQKEINDLREKIDQARKKLEENDAGAGQGRPRDPFFGPVAQLARIAEEAGIAPEDMRRLQEYRRQRTDPKRQLNPQISETVTLKLHLADDAELGPREIRLLCRNGLSNPLRFLVGQWRECCEREPNNKVADSSVGVSLPVVINGQITPGDVDRFAFEARQGTRLVVAASARELMPYLADAVPGWFQATLALYDAQGDEVAYADDYRFNPDPVLYFEIPADGQYTLEIKDAVYRGRDDFVYRITLGETPFVTGVFPLGGSEKARTNIKLAGWNLPTDSLTIRPDEKQPGVQQVLMQRGQRAPNPVLFSVDALPEIQETEPNNDVRGAQSVRMPMIVNGRIDRPGDFDVFRVHGRAGQTLVAEVMARRLNSPLDSLLELLDADGRQLAVNDDHEDLGDGLSTHHADSRLSFKLPAEGDYLLRLRDTQNHGGPAYAYRLRISPPRPDFALRMTPSTLNVRPGASVPLTVFALRDDDFAGEIALELIDPPSGFRLDAPTLPAGQDRVRLTLSVPTTALETPIPLRLQGRAKIGNREMVREAVPADDMMQAFIYHQLVPAEELMVASPSGRRTMPRIRPRDSGPVRIPIDGTASLRLVVPYRPFTAEVKLELSDPPAGLTIDSVAPTNDGLAVQLRAAAPANEAQGADSPPAAKGAAQSAAAQVGLRGNLIFEAYVERAPPNPQGKAAEKRRIPVGTLPAIPFEIVQR